MVGLQQEIADRKRQRNLQKLISITITKKTLTGQENVSSNYI